MELLKKTYESILNDGKLIRLATLTSIFHSLVFMCLVSYQVYSIFRITQNDYNSDIFVFYQQLFSLITSSNEVIISFIVIGIIAVVGYYLVPPISDAALIHYLDTDGEKKISTSIFKGVFHFFPLLEYNSMISIFSVYVFSYAIMRMWASGMLGNPLVITVGIIWMISVLIIQFLIPYTKFIMVLEGKGLFEALGASAKIAIENFTTTGKFVLLKFFLSFRFIVNVVFLFGVPFILTLISTLSIDIDTIKVIFFSVLGLIFLLTAYTTGIIEAFFMTYWYNVYRSLNPKPILETSTATNDTPVEA